MKKFIATLTSIFIAVLVMAQSPDVMNYQAVARNNAGQALANQTIKVRLTITKNAVYLYSETRQVTTNALGLFNIQIGSAGAISTTGSFSGINWQNNPTTHYLKVELDINNGTTFTDMGMQALVSVPYSFHSKTADKATEAIETINIAGRPIDQTATPTVGARLSWNGTNWAPVKKDSIYNISYEPMTSSITATSSWIFISDITPVFVVSSGDRIVADLVSSVRNASPSTRLELEVAICYQNTNTGSPMVPFSSTPTRVTILPALSPSIYNAGLIAAKGAISLPPGNYKISLAIKLLSTGNAVEPGLGINGTIEVRH